MINNKIFKFASILCKVFDLALKPFDFSIKILGRLQNVLSVLLIIFAASPIIERFNISAFNRLVEFIPGHYRVSIALFIFLILFIVASYKLQIKLERQIISKTKLAELNQIKSAIESARIDQKNKKELSKQDETINKEFVDKIKNVLRQIDDSLVSDWEPIGPHHIVEICDNSKTSFSILQQSTGDSDFLKTRESAVSYLEKLRNKLDETIKDIKKDYDISG